MLPDRCARGKTFLYFLCASFVFLCALVVNETVQRTHRRGTENTKDAQSIDRGRLVTLKQ
jgi:hypothetical protein